MLDFMQVESAFIFILLAEFLLAIILEGVLVMRDAKVSQRFLKMKHR